MENKKLAWWLVGLLCLFTFFVNTGALPTDIMESRNIITAREIVNDGNWLVPTMNGELRLEKPPLPTWVAAAIETVCPDNLAVQRLAAGVMGLMWTVFLFLTARYISRRDDYALATVTVFLTCYNLILMGRSATWDIYCHAFMMGAIYFLARGFYDEHHPWRWFPLAGLMMGLSFLSKGPVSFYALLLPFLLVMFCFPRPQMKGKWGAFTLTIVIMLIVGGWWYVCLNIYYPEQVKAVIAKESGNWANHNVRPWYYYWRFFLEMGIWSLLMLASLTVTYWRRHISMKREYLFSITSSIVTLVLLSLMPEKKTRYLLPLLVPCSMVVATLLIHFKDNRNHLDKYSRILFHVNGYLMGGIVLVLPVLAYVFGVRHGIISWPVEIMLSLCLIAVGVWMLRCTHRVEPMGYVAGVAALFMTAELFLLPTIGHAFGNPDAHSISAVREVKSLEGIPFYYDEQESLRIELVYEAHRKILPLNLHDSATVASRLPMAIVTHGGAADVLPASLLNQVDTVTVGVFDDNKHPKSNKHYTKDFINRVTLIKKKQ